MLELGMVDEEDIKNIAPICFNQAKGNSNYAKIYCKMLELGMVDNENIKNNKQQYDKELKNKV